MLRGRVGHCLQHARVSPVLCCCTPCIPSASSLTRTCTVPASPRTAQHTLSTHILRLKQHPQLRQRGPLRAATASAGGASCVYPHPSHPDHRPFHTHILPDAPITSTSTYLRVVLPTALALMLCNMDRICLSVAIVPIAAELQWSITTQGLVQSAFLWGYMATQLLGGALADRYGGKVVLGWAIALFSCASLLLPLAVQPQLAATTILPLAIAARVAVGLGEGVALPAMNNLIATRIPPTAKATALGQVFSGFHTGNIIGLLMSPLLLATYGWRALFYVFGALGVPLWVFWQTTVPDHYKQQQSSSTPAAISTTTTNTTTTTKSTTPGSPPLSSSSPPKHVTPTTTPKTPSVSPLDLLASPAVLAIVIVNFINHWGYFIYLNWMPSFFYKALGLDLRASSFLSLLPWVTMAVGSSAAGLLADGLVKRGWSVTRVRKTLQAVAFLGPAISLLVLTSVPLTPALAVGCLTAALGITSLGQAGFVANMSDIAPTHAGQLFGLCNTFGSAAGILGTWGVGVMVEATGSFASVFQVTAVMYVVGIAVWLAMCTSERQF